MGPLLRERHSRADWIENVSEARSQLGEVAGREIVARRCAQPKFSVPGWSDDRPPGGRIRHEIQERDAKPEGPRAGRRRRAPIMIGGFGAEIRRLRLLAGLSLRGLAQRLEISPAHLSDVERDLRRPSDALFERIVHELRDAGADAPVLLLLLTGLDGITRRWATTTPGVRALLHKCIRTGLPPAELIRILDEACPPGPDSD